MTNHSQVPRSLYEITNDRMASSLARPPAFRITWASPSARPAYFAGSRRASIQVRIAKWRLGGNGRLPLSPKFSAYFAFAESTSPRILAIAFTSCSKFSALESIRKLNAVPRHLPLVDRHRLRSRHTSVTVWPCPIPAPSRDVAPAATTAPLGAISKRHPEIPDLSVVFNDDFRPAASHIRGS